MHATKRRFFFLLLSIVKISLSSNVSSAYTMGLIPVQLRQPDSACSQAYACDAFELSPTALPVLFLESREVVNRGVNRDDFDVVNRLKDLKVHEGPIAAVLPNDLIEIKAVERRPSRICRRKLREIRDFSQIRLRNLFAHLLTRVIRLATLGSPFFAKFVQYVAIVSESMRSTSVQGHGCWPRRSNS